MNIFSEFDHKLRGLQDSVDWAVEQLKAKDKEIAGLKKSAEYSRKCDIAVLGQNTGLRNELTAKDREIADLKSALDARSISVINAEAQSLLRAELKAKDERLSGAAELLNRAWRVLGDIPCRELRSDRPLHGWEYCGCCQLKTDDLMFNGTPYCYRCIRRMLGAPERRA